jgi:DNA (cytosine-5)-methyltransferase 1
MTSPDKPPYAVLSMAEIRALPWNGLNVISTFSGCGGSSLGYKMAGFKVLWANEFVQAARDTYAANAPDTILDSRDIRSISPQSILDAIGMKRGDLDLLDGSPPCASFSTAGNRARDWGKVKAYSDTSQQTDDLFFEFVRILDGLQPRAFVAENVSGLVKGVAKGYFLEILAAMKACGYNVKAKLLDSRWLGVPQKRQRLIFIGIRNDLELEPTHPKPLTYFYSVRDALPWISGFEADSVGWGDGPVVIRDASRDAYLTVGASASSGNGRLTKVIHDTGGAWGEGDITDRSAPTVMAQGAGHMQMSYSQEDNQPGLRKFNMAELRRICGFPDDFILTGSYAQQWERLGRAVPPVMMSYVAKEVAATLCAD